MAWTGEEVAQTTCAKDMERLAAAYSNDKTQTFQLSWDNRPDSFNQTLTAFMILRNQFALLQLGVIGPYECTSTPCGCDSHLLPDAQCPNPGHYPGGGYGPYRWSELLNRDYGEPLEGLKVVAGVWSRQWSKANVTLDCSSWTATILMIE